MRVHSKSQLADATTASWKQLWSMVDSLSINDIEIRKKVPTNSPPRSIKDHLAHLHAWHLLFLEWYSVGKSGTTELPAKGYRWNETRELNRKLFDQWKDISYPSIRRRLKLSHNRIIKVVNSTNENDLLSVGIFEWTGNLSLAKYVAANTASHYNWAIKRIKIAAASSRRKRATQ